MGLPKGAALMTLRITPAGSGQSTTLKIDGRLTSEEVPELRLACDRVEGPLVLDLSGLQSADRQGVSVLQELRTKGAELIGTSPYLQLLLDRAPAD
jgi:anti-anti-sigma regulatory factor